MKNQNQPPAASPNENRQNRLICPDCGSQNLALSICHEAIDLEENIQVNDERLDLECSDCGKYLKVSELTTSEPNVQIKEILQDFVDLMDNIETDSFCELCGQHAPQDEDGKITGPVPHKENCSLIRARHILKPLPAQKYFITFKNVEFEPELEAHVGILMDCGASILESQLETIDGTAWVQTLIRDYQSFLEKFKETDSYEVAELVNVTNREKA